jgi:hypothetical protein
MTRIEPERVVAAALPALEIGARRSFRGDGALRPLPVPGGGDA